MSVGREPGELARAVRRRRTPSPGIARPGDDMRLLDVLRLARIALAKHRQPPRVVDDAVAVPTSNPRDVSTSSRSSTRGQLPILELHARSDAIASPELRAATGRSRASRRSYPERSAAPTPCRQARRAHRKGSQPHRGHQRRRADRLRTSCCSRRTRTSPVRRSRRARCGSPANAGECASRAARRTRRAASWLLHQPVDTRGKRHAAQLAEDRRMPYRTAPNRRRRQVQRAGRGAVLPDKSPRYLI